MRQQTLKGYKMTKILQNNKAMAEAMQATIGDHAKADEAKTVYNTSAMTSLCYNIAFLLDFGAFNNKATKAYEAALRAEDCEVVTDTKRGFVASYTRQRPIAKHPKVRKIVEGCKTVEAIQLALSEAGYPSIGKLITLTAKPLAKLSDEAKAACDAMMATDAVQTFIAELDEDQQSAFERSVENTVRNADTTHANNAKAQAKADLKARMKSEAEAKSANAS